MRDPADGVEGTPTKLDLLREEFGRTMAALPADTRFDLVVYRYPSCYPPQPKLTRAFGRLEPATKASRKRAVDWLSGQEAEGWGAFHEPLLAAMDEDADTAILLSDGRPSRGRFDRDFRILAELPEANRFRQLSVSTVLVGSSGADRSFMADLAAATGGFFREAAGN
jgi:hypothetical protein